MDGWVDTHTHYAAPPSLSLCMTLMRPDPTPNMLDINHHHSPVLDGRLLKAERRERVEATMGDESYGGWRGGYNYKGMVDRGLLHNPVPSSSFPSIIGGLIGDQGGREGAYMQIGPSLPDFEGFQML